MIKKLALLWAISAGALMLLPVVFGEGVNIADWKAAMIAAVVVGIVNTVIRPVLKLVTLPIRWLTLGLFTLVINGACLFGATKLVDGFEIDGFFPTAILAAVVYSVVTYIAAKILIHEDDD